MRLREGDSEVEHSVGSHLGIQAMEKQRQHVLWRLEVFAELVMSATFSWTPEQSTRSATKERTYKFGDLQS